MDPEEGEGEHVDVDRTDGAAAIAIIATIAAAPYLVTAIGVLRWYQSFNFKLI